MYQQLIILPMRRWHRNCEKKKKKSNNLREGKKTTRLYTRV